MTKKFGEAINTLLEAWNDYQDQPESFWNAVDAARQAQPVRPIAKTDNFQSHAAFITFCEQLDAYDLRGDLDEEPSESFWRALDAVYRARDAHHQQPNRPESIASLLKQRVGAPQICAMWGLVDEHGRPDLDLLTREEHEPGSVVTEAWEWPTLRKWRAEREEAYEIYKAHFAEETAEDEPPLRKPCPESPEDLYRQGVGEAQAAKMLVKDPSEVADLWAEFRAALGEPDQAVKVTDPDNDPLPDYVPTRGPVVGQQEAEATEQPSAYDSMSDDELRDLCAVAEVEASEDRNEMIARLAEADERQVAG